MAGRPVDAARSLTAALDEIDRVAGSAPSRDRLDLRCKTLITLALTEFMLSGVEAALARLAEAEALVDEPRRRRAAGPPRLPARQHPRPRR